MRRPWLGLLVALPTAAPALALGQRPAPGIGSPAWAYTFTQEWPLWGRSHQLSYTIPVERGTGLGDGAVNYRYQLSGAERLSVAPRLSLLLPTARAGALGVQANLPVSVVVARTVVTHRNAGATVIRSAGTGYNLGASAAWLVRPAFDLLLEAAWTTSEASGDDLFIGPGIRWAHDLAGGLQIVPGIALPVGVGPSAGERTVFLYLSFEHPFRRSEP